MNYFGKRKNAMAAALSGLAQAFKGEAHLRLHALAAFIAIAAGIYFSISDVAWVAVAGCITLVISLELINSAVEKLCDLVMPEQHPAIKYIKDVCAAAVLLACILSLVVAYVVFIKRFL